MDDKSRRKELVDNYKRTPPEAGVFRIVNRETGRALLGSSPNLPSVRNKVDFARSTGSAGALDRRLRDDFCRLGPDAFSVEVLDLLEVTPEMTEAQIRDDLAALEELWRERLDPAQLYLSTPGPRPRPGAAYCFPTFT